MKRQILLMHVADQIDQAAIEIAKFHLGIRPEGIEIDDAHDHAMWLIGNVGHSIWAAREILGHPPMAGLDEYHRRPSSEYAAQQARREANCKPAANSRGGDV